MSTVSAKLERIVEAVRENLEGDEAIEFLHRNGHAVTSAGLVRHLRRLGGRGRILDLIAQGLDNQAVLQICLPEESFVAAAPAPPAQAELFQEPGVHAHGESAAPLDLPLYETTKLTLRVPSDLYEALRIAAKVEHKSQNRLVVEILTSALSRMPEFPPG